MSKRCACRVKFSYELPKELGASSMCLPTSMVASATPLLLAGFWPAAQRCLIGSVTCTAALLVAKIVILHSQSTCDQQAIGGDIRLPIVCLFDIAEQCQDCRQTQA
jgi:hypothetical protein